MTVVDVRFRKLDRGAVDTGTRTSTVSISIHTVSEPHPNDDKKQTVLNLKYGAAPAVVKMIRDAIERGASLRESEPLLG